MYPITKEIKCFDIVDCINDVQKILITATSTIHLSLVSPIKSDNDKVSYGEIIAILNTSQF